MKVQGYEKFWTALLGGGASTSLTVFALWLASLVGAVPMPTQEAIAAAITGLVASVVAALGALLATNTPPSPPDAG